MGVQGLWDLLAPVGRRVSVETLAGRRLAIDASIWLIQFVKAMRDEKGDMVRNAHLIGFFRRICKLLFLRTKPVFVFDGGTPSLKRRTVIARRRQREQAQAKIRKTAEKLLLNHLKAQKIDEIAKEIQSQRAALACSREPVTDHNTSSEISSEKMESFVTSRESKSLDELLAASLAAEEDGGSFSIHASGNAGAIFTEHEDEGNEDGNMIPLEMHEKLDPAILAALPPSMQLDLLVQMRERLIAENRQKYQKVKKVPSKFSELQIEAYLKTVAFRQEIDEVQKAASRRGISGVQTSRIASESNKEFIFSSSFKGDKRSLMTATTERNESIQALKDSAIPSSVKPNFSVGGLARVSSTASVPEVGQDIGTYIDERGHVRVSKVRGLGIRATCDLQRNLDMMKEFEQAKGKEDGSALGEAIFESVSDPHYSLHASVITDTDESDDPFAAARTAENAIEISFLENDISLMSKEEDVMFAQIIANENILSSIQEELPSTLEIDANVDDEVTWEEGSCVAPRPLSCASEPVKVPSKGQLEEEANIQEAIKRSLEDIARDDSDTLSIEVSDTQSLTVMPDNQGELPRRHNPQPCEINGASTGIYLKPHFLCGQESRESVIARQRQEEVCAEDTQKVTDSAITNVASSFVKESCKNSEIFHVGSSSHIFQNALSGQEETKISPADDIVISTSVTGHIARSLVDTDNSVLAENESRSKEYRSSFLCMDELSSVLQDQRNDEFHAHRSCMFANNKFNFEGGPSITEMSPSVRDADTDASKCRGLSSEDVLITHSDELNMETGKSPNSYLDDEKLHLQRERDILGDEQRKLEKNSEFIGAEMFAECQELLQMFGLPYIVAPMEAEAQCAYMEMTNMVDGVVTDDSDVFLFGAASVYKNIFDDRKYVETYFMKDVETELGLTREKLIRMALLLGSDYTEGVSGIGIVNAIEVINAFPEEDGLQVFRKWVESPDPAILTKFSGHSKSNSRKKYSEASKIEADSLANTVTDSLSEATSLKCDRDEELVDDLFEREKIFMDKHRNVSKNWHIPSSFPNQAVISAYSTPQVDESTEPFSWGRPDLGALRKLCWEKFGWSIQKADELLVPVLKEYNRHETQLRLEAFYSFNERFAKIRSKRIKQAVKEITRNSSSEIMLEELAQDSKQKARKAINDSKITDHVVDCLSGMRYSEAQTKKRGKEKIKNDLSRSVRGRGNGSAVSRKRGKEKTTYEANTSRRGRGKGRAGRSCKQKMEADIASSSTSDSGEWSHSKEIMKEPDLHKGDDDKKRKSRWDMNRRKCKI